MPAIRVNCTSFSPQPTFSNCAHITYFCMRMTQVSPQPTFFSGIFTTYLCMIFVCENCARCGHYTSLIPSFFPKAPKIASLKNLCNISKRKGWMNLTFCMKVNINLSYNLILSTFVSMINQG